MLLTQLHTNLGHMQLKPAHDCLAEYERNWGDIGLTWEPALLDFLNLNGSPAGADQGWSVWLSLVKTEFWAKIPLSVQIAVRMNYFQMIVGLLEEDGQTTSPSGISKGRLHLLAGRLESALALLKREVSERADDPLPSLYLGNAQYLLSDTWAARASYRDALLRGLKCDHHAEILDGDLRAFLRETETTEWAVIEGCITGVLPTAHLRSANSTEAFLQKHGWLRNQDPCALPSPVRQFYDCLVVSESRSVVPEDLLMKARLHMKFLNGRLHKVHMDALDAKQE